MNSHLKSAYIRPMQVIHSISEFKKARRKLTGSLGMIPTMGYLHEGHLELVRQAKKKNAHVVISIFVNPTQFGPNEDFSSYPRDTERDLALLQPLDVDIVFMPSAEEMYPPLFQTFVEVEKVSQGLEGKPRPGHFRGVATVVAKLFNIIQPDQAYFGQKDAQQVAVIKQMVEDLAFPLEINVVPIVRDTDGLALSSRNVYLAPEQRQAAPVLFRALTKAKKLYKEGERNTQNLHSAMLEIFKEESLAEVQYISIADARTLEEVTENIQKPILISLAVRFGKTRLIDNILIP
jgi:pantoate--beta-alanine ligase